MPRDPSAVDTWSVSSVLSSTFDFDYAGGREPLLRLYEAGTRRQWIGKDRLDWSHEVDPDSPTGMRDELHPLYGSPWWVAADGKRRAEMKRHLDAWRFSQFLHGEQGALICSAKIVQTVPSLDAKFYAATQVVDEARHVEVYRRFLEEKIGFGYPINRHLKSLLENVVSDSRWDMTYLGMQVLIEGLALASFTAIRNETTDPLARALNAYVMQDEARHVAFGRLALRDYYPHLSDSERREREEFCVDACFLMRDRFLAEEVWETLELPAEAARFVAESAQHRNFGRALFLRIVPALKDIGLFGEKLQHAFADMGVVDLEPADLDRAMAEDDALATELDARAAHVAAVATDKP